MSRDNCLNDSSRIRYDAAVATAQRTGAELDGEPPVGGLLRAMLEQWIERPSPEINAVLDAAAQCFARHGLAHTSVPDIARELGVSKATVYRQVGSVADVVRLLLARELHDLVDELAAALSGADGVDSVILLAVTVTRHASENPLAQKLLADEPHLVGELLPSLPMVLAATTAVLRPYLEASMRSGAIRSGDPAALAELIVRLAAIAVLAPPSDLAAYFRAALRPHLEPT